MKLELELYVDNSVTKGSTGLRRPQRYSGLSRRLNCQTVKRQQNCKLIVCHSLINTPFLSLLFKNYQYCMYFTTTQTLSLQMPYGTQLSVLSLIDGGTRRSALY